MRERRRDRRANRDRFNHPLYVVGQRAMSDATNTDIVEGPFAWRCCDGRFPFVYGLVTSQQVTVDAWRKSGIEFQALYPRDVAQTPADSVDLLRRARQFVSDGGCDEDDMGVHLERLELLEEMDAVIISGVAQTEPKAAGRQWIVELIRDQFDPKPSDYRPGDNWDDGAGAIADAILAQLPLLHAEGSAVSSTPQGCAAEPQAPGTQPVAWREAFDALLAFRHGDTKHLTQEHAQILVGALMVSRPTQGGEAQ